MTHFSRLGTWFGHRSLSANTNVAPPRKRPQIEELESRYAPTASLVADINLFPSSAESNAGNFVAVGATAFFTATDATHGTELWKSDGTASGTVLEADIVPGSGDGSLGNLTVVGSKLYFSATTEANGAELWLDEVGPTIASVTPYVGPTSGGNYVVIVGADFTGATAVNFGSGNPGSNITEVGGTQITVIAPSGAGVVNVTVTTPGGTSNTSGTDDDYTYAVPAVVSVEVNGGEIQATDALGVIPALAGQNSVVEQLLVTFNQAVTLDANAFEVQSLWANVTVSGGISPSTANVSVAATGRSGFGNASAGFTQYILTFDAGAGTTTQDNTNTGNGGVGNIFQYLKDGFYELITDGAKVHAGGTLLGEAGSSSSDKFWALYGATKPGVNVFPSSPLGDGNSVLLVDSFALDDIYASFGSFSSDPVGPPPYSTEYDSNLDGLMDSFDLDAMYANFGTVWEF